MAGPFERAYARGVTEKVGPPPSRPQALPPAPFALHGAVITPDGAWSSGYVTVAAGLIAAVSKQKPTDVPACRDRRGDPARADRPARPPGLQRSPREPPKPTPTGTGGGPKCAVQGVGPRPAEHPQARCRRRHRAGMRRAASRRYDGDPGFERKASKSAEPLVRNVDLWIFGDHKARSMIDLPSASSRDSLAGEDRRGHRDR